MLALIAVLAVDFVVVAIVLVNPWAAVIVVSVSWFTGNLVVYFFEGPKTSNI